MTPEKQIRIRALAAWWHSRTGEYALVLHLDRLATIEVPIDMLIELLEEIRSQEDVRGLGYFTSHYGIGRLRELESQYREQTAPRPGGAQKLGELLPYPGAG